MIIASIIACTNQSTQSPGVKNKQNKKEDRYIALVKLDTVTKYLKMTGVEPLFVDEGFYNLTVTTELGKREVFYQNILGQQLTWEDGREESLEFLIKESKYTDKWEPIMDREKKKYGFKARIEKRDGVKYVYLPYEIIINLNNK